MKRTLIIFAAMAFLVCSCNPLRIVMDKNKNGERTIVTSEHRMFGYKDGHFSAALGCQIHGKDTVLAILLSSDADKGHAVFDKDDKLMFRLKDGHTITLSNVYDRSAYHTEVKTETYSERVVDYTFAYNYSPWVDAFYVSPYQINTFVPRTRTYRESTSYALYLLSLKELIGVCYGDVVKVRVEVDDGYAEQDPANGISDLFKELAECLGKRARADFKEQQF